MFNFLLKYPESIWRQSEFVFASGWPLSLLAVCIVIAAVFLAWSIFSRPLGALKKTLLWVLQVLGVSILLTLLWQPNLRLKVVDPAENSVSLLLDTSRSMAYQDSDTSRIEEVQNALEETGLVDQLAAKYSLDLAVFSANANKVSEEDLVDDAVEAVGASSNIATALLESVEENSSRVVAGVILVSDGSNTTNPDPAFWQQLVAARVPVYTVGVGQTKLSEDIAISDVALSPTVAAEATVTARVDIRYGEPGPARLRVFDGKKLLYAQTIELPEGSDKMSHQANFVSGEEGLVDLKFELEARAGEKNLVNNSQRRILSVRADKKRILYVEGQPRWEFKFIRRALHTSPELDLVTLLHTSPNKFYRQGVRDAEELAEGFPQSREELFDYDGIIIGSLEAAQLSEEQQQNIRDFVRVRGGSLLMLAGSSGLSNGGWTRSSVAQALPVSLVDSPGSYLRKRAQVDVTELGLQTDWLKLDPVEESNLSLWHELPPLADVQLSGEPKVGATVLLEAVHSGERQPLLVWQRYGRGKSYVMATSGTWRWQMGLPAEDQRHERFWQGLLGDLVSAVLPRLSVTTSQPVYLDQKKIIVSVEARDKQFEPDSGASLKATVRGPDGESQVTVYPEPDVPGRFRTEIDATIPGEYSISVTQSGNGETLEKEAWFLRLDGVAEDYALAQDKEFLERVASETGGQYLTLDALGSLPEIMQQSESRLVRVESLPLWNLPLVFLVLLFIKLVEWALRWRWNRL